MSGVQRVSGSTVPTDYGQVVELPRPSETQADDIIIAVLGTTQHGTYTLPSGWETVLDHPIPGSGSGLTIIQRRMQSDEPTSYTFEFEHRAWVSVAATVYRNAGPLQAGDYFIRSASKADTVIVPSRSNGGQSLTVLAGFSSEAGFLSWEPEPLASRSPEGNGVIMAMTTTLGEDHKLRATHGFHGSMAAFAVLVRPKTSRPQPNPSLGVTFRDAPNRSDVRRVAEVGSNLARLRISWDELEPDTYGTFDQGKLSELLDVIQEFDAHGITVLALMDGDTPPTSTTASDWQSFCERFALEAIPAGVRHFQLWDEPNIREQWHDPVSASDYVDHCLQPGWAGVDSASDTVGFNAYVLLGGLAPATAIGDVDMVDFLDDAYTAGAKGYFDAVAYHPANDPAPPDFDEALGLRSTMVANNDDELLVWVTDIGWPSRDSTLHEVYPVDAASEFISHERAAKYARKAPEEWEALGVWTGPMLWVARDTEFDVPGFNHRRNAAGLMLRNLSRKGAWFRWQRESAKRREPEPQTPPSADDDPDLFPAPQQFRTSAITAVEVDASWREAVGAAYRLTREKFVGHGSPIPDPDPDTLPTPRPLITSVRMAGAGQVRAGSPVGVVSASVGMAGAGHTVQAKGRVRRKGSASMAGAGTLGAVGRMLYDSDAITVYVDRMDGTGPYYAQGDAGHGGPYSPDDGQFAEAAVSPFLTDPTASYYSQADLPLDANSGEPDHDEVMARPMRAAWCAMTQPGRSDREDIFSAVRTLLLDHANDPTLDYSNSTNYPDDFPGFAAPPSFAIAEWILKLFKARDMLGRSRFSAAENDQLDEWMYGYANWVFSWLHNEAYGSAIPGRLSRDYSNIQSNWPDGNGSFAYDGGPELTNASGAYTNRHATCAMAASFAVNYLAASDVEPTTKSTPSYGTYTVSELLDHSRLFVEEMLRFSVFPEGVQGDFDRSDKDKHGSTVSETQGYTYSCNAVHSAVRMAGYHERRGDSSVFDFETTAGVGGSEGSPLDPRFSAKSLHFIVAALVRYTNDEYGRTYDGEPLTTPDIIGDVFPAVAMNRHATADGLLAAAWRREGAGMPAYPQNPESMGPWEAWRGQGGVLNGIIEDAEVGYVAAPAPARIAEAGASLVGSGATSAVAEEPEGDEFYTDFGEYAVASGLPSGWSVVEVEPGQSFAIEDDSQAGEWDSSTLVANRALKIEGNNTHDVIRHDSWESSTELDVTVRMFSNNWANLAGGIAFTAGSSGSGGDWSIRSLNDNAIRVRMAALYGGGGGDLTLPFTNQNWGHMYLRVRKANGRAKVTASQTEAGILGETPAVGWLLDIEDPEPERSMPPGLVGDAQDSWVFFDEVWVGDPATGGPSTDQWFSDFNSDTLGVTEPEGMSLELGGTDEWEVVSGGSGQLLELSPTGGNGDRIMSADIADNEEDVDIVVRCSYAGLTSNVWKVLLFARRSPDNQYVFMYRAESSNGLLSIENVDDGNISQIASTSVALVPSGDWFWLRARADGQQLSFRFWEDGDPEPSTWDISLSDSTHTVGISGVGGFDGGEEVSYDVVGVGVNGEAAPTS